MAQKVLVGMLLLAALFIFALATFYVENWQFVLGRVYRLQARFPYAQTLDEGDVVRLEGVPVGTVQELEIETQVATDKPVKVTLGVRELYEIRADDRAIIRVASLFGGNYVAIERGDPDRRVLEDGDWIEETSVAPSITEVIEESTRTLSRVNTAFDDLSIVLEDVTEGKGTLGKLIRSEDFYDKLEGITGDVGDAVASLKKASGHLEKGEGTLGKLIMDDQMADDVQSLTADASELTDRLRSISAEVQAGKGTLGKLLTEDALHSEVRETVGSINELTGDLRGGEGLFPRMLRDGALAEDVSELAGNLRSISEKADKGEGTLGKFLSSDEAYRKLNKSLDDINSVTGDLADGKGTLGKLVKDDKLHRQVSQILADVQGLLETYREQSPVISFAGAVFGAF